MAAFWVITPCSLDAACRCFILAAVRTWNLTNGQLLITIIHERNVMYLETFFMPYVCFKQKLSHYAPWRHLGGEGLQHLLILDLGTRRGWVLSVTPRLCFSPGERTPGTHWTGSWVGPRAGLDTEAPGKISLPLPGIEPRSSTRPACSQTIYWLSYPAHLKYVLLTWKHGRLQECFCSGSITKAIPLGDASFHMILENGTIILSVRIQRFRFPTLHSKRFYFLSTS
jgi:hypothetical protein